MGEVNQRLRVMLGIDTTKPTGDLANGRGGDDGPMPDGKDTAQGASLITSALEQRQPVRKFGIRTSSQADFAAENIEEIALQVRESIDALVREATQQEEALQSLTQIAEQRSTQWASTPVYLAGAWMGHLCFWSAGFAVY